jgi:ABC-2 type transport system permease protein
MSTDLNTGTTGTTGTTETATAPRHRTSSSSPALPRIPGPRPDRPVSLGRLVGVEWRKQVDTRAGLWLLISIGLITAGVLVIMFFVGGGAHSWGDYLLATATPMSILLPIVGILAATSEWSQRTGLTTFALEPRRPRVVLAKALSSLLTAVATLVLSVALSAGVHQLAVSLRGVEADWSMSWAVLGGVALMIALSLIQGVAFGLALLNTPGAIVAYLVLPTVWGILGGLISWLKDAATWLDVNTSMEPLLSGTMTGAQWAHLGTASLVWVGLPLAFGLWRVVRAELK